MAEQDNKAKVALHGAGNCPCEVRGEKGRKEGRKGNSALLRFNNGDVGV